MGTETRKIEPAPSDQFIKFANYRLRRLTRNHTLKYSGGALHDLNQSASFDHTHDQPASVENTHDQPASVDHSQVHSPANQRLFPPRQSSFQEQVKTKGI